MTDIGASERLKDAPSPEDPRKPDSMGEIEGRSWKYSLRKTFREFSSDQCTDIAASLTYYAVLSFFPALIAIISLLGVFGQGPSATNALLDILRQVAPSDVVETLAGPIQGFVDSPAAGFALVSGTVLAIWSASGYVGAFTRAMNRIYEIDEGRPFWKLKPVQLLITVIGILLILIIALLLVVSGPIAETLGNAVGVGSTFVTVWDIAKWPVIAFVIVLMVAILYYGTPNVKQPKFRWISVGALTAIVVLVIASVLFALYVANFSNYAKNYGALAGVVVFLLWLWIANLALLFGAEFDAELERSRQLQAGIAAEEDIQLPPRDITKSAKAADKEEQDVADGRAIREQNAAQDPEAAEKYTSGGSGGGKK